MMHASHERVPLWVSLIVCTSGCAGMFLVALATWPEPALVLEILQQRSLRPWFAPSTAATLSWYSVVSGSATTAVIAVVMCGLVVACTRLMARLAAQPPSDLVRRIPQRNDAVRR